MLTKTVKSNVCRISKENLPEDIADSKKQVLEGENTLHLIQQKFEVSYQYPVCFTRGAFSPKNTILRALTKNPNGKPSRVLVAIDEGLAHIYSNLVRDVVTYANTHKDSFYLVDEPWLIPGGEACKNTENIAHRLYQYSQENQICRHSYVVVIGGGAVIDAVGYAAATAHRGIHLIRMPTTVLAQNDAGVGVKNSINWRGRKNFVGTFVPPYAVVNDFQFLDKLPAREKISGIAEAVKVSLISDSTFFDYLYQHKSALAKLQNDVVESMIVRCAELHLRHIRTSGDPFEKGNARPLDFGHWSAHKMEELSQHTLRHGEAVAIGIALDTLYSVEIGMLKAKHARTIFEILESIGFDLYHPSLEMIDIESSLNEFREHLGGELCITLLTNIGERLEVNKINVDVMKHCVQALKQRKQGGV